jgi:flagellar biosynthesis protein FliR
MPSSPVFHVSTLYGFLLVLARLSGIFIFLPLPGFKAGPDVAKITLAGGLTFALFSRWSYNQAHTQSKVQLAGWMLLEVGTGLAIGLAVAFITEGLIMAAQAVSTQAGFAYASMIDPNTEADSTVLIQIAQLTSGLLFFAMGLDRQLLAILARSLETHPPGGFVTSGASVEALVALGTGAFSTGLRLALPLVALLFLIDLSVGLLGRLNSQLQLTSLAFPAKILVSLAALSTLAVLIPRLFQQSAAASFNVLAKFLGL